MKRSDLHPHPNAGHVPQMDPDEYNALVEDIAARGIVVPLDVLADGTILDGRHRWLAAGVLNLETVPARTVAPPDPYRYMILAALRRRDLTKSQKAMLALRLDEYGAAKVAAKERQAGHGGTAPGRPNTPRTNAQSVPPPDRDVFRSVAESGRAAAVVAKVAGVSPRYVEAAQYVARHDPKLAERVADGDVGLTQAVKHVKEQHYEAIREASPEVDAAYERSRFHRLLADLSKVPVEMAPAYWADRICPEDRALLDRHIDSVETWIAAWRDHRPSLHVIGGRK